MSATSYPDVSIVIPTYRRPERIARCLDSLLELEYPQERLQVVVVEDGGPTAEHDDLRARDFGGLEVLFLGQPHAGPAVARNLGARHARGELLAFTDDDCCPRPDWIAQLLAVHGGRERTLVGGHTINALAGNVLSGASQALVSYITRYGQDSGEPFFASNNILVPRNLFNQIGGFDETFPLAGGEDRELCDRLHHLGVAQLHAPEALIDHYHHLSPGSFWRQHFRYGRGAYRYHLSRADRSGTSLVQEYGSMARTMLRFYTGLLSWPFGGRERRPLSTSLLLLGSQVPNTLGFFAEKLSERR